MCKKLFQVNKRYLWYRVMMLILIVLLANCGEPKKTYCEITYHSPDFSKDGKKIAFLVQTYTYDFFDYGMGWIEKKNEVKQLQVYSYDLATGASQLIYDLGNQLVWHELKWNPKSYITIHHIDNADYIIKVYPETKDTEIVKLTHHADDFCLPDDTDIIIYTDGDTIYIENIDKFDTWIKEIKEMDRNYQLMYLDSERLLGIAGRNTNLILRFFDNYDSYTITKFGGNILSSIDWIDSTHFISGNKPFLYELKDTSVIKKQLIADITDWTLSYDKNKLLGFTKNYKDNGTVLNHNIILVEDIDDSSNIKTILQEKKIELKVE